MYITIYQRGSYTMIPVCWFGSVVCTNNNSADFCIGYMPPGLHAANTREMCNQRVVIVVLV